MQAVSFDTEALKTWFRKAKRSLPWRENPTPYAVWVSEIMLQQTQVSVVKDYFSRWMIRFPTITALASASQEEVIKAWEGLGYYSRARNLHAAAQFLVDHYNGEFPPSKEVLLEIKGLGPYTTGAILSFAFHKKAAAVDGNGIRVLSRYYAITEDVQKTATLKKIWEIAEEMLPNQEPWVVVEGLIELGATVCKKEPDCLFCPLRQSCKAYQKGIQRDLPKKGKKIEITPLTRDVFVVTHGQEILLRQEKEGKVMAGLYEFPYTEQKTGFPFSFPVEELAKLPLVEHSFTRYRVKLYPTLWKAIEKIDLPDYDWIPWSEIKKYPFSSGHRRILKELHAHFTH